MSDYDQKVKQAIVAHYLRQNGSGYTQYPVFQGAPYQYGNGIGDIFKSIGRFLLPIFSSSAKTFVSSTAKGLEEGQSWKEAAKDALKPTISTALKDTGTGVIKRLEGSGRKRSRRHTSKSKSSKSRVYKGHKQRGGRRKTKVHKKLRFSPTNF